MLIALLLVAGLAWWLHREGLLIPNLTRLAVAAGGLFIGARLLSTGKPLAGLIVLGAAWAWWQVQRPRRGDPLADARALLGVAADADADAINAAWRTAMARAHPDAGGNAEATRALLDARDALLSAQRRRNEL